MTGTAGGPDLSAGRAALLQNRPTTRAGRSERLGGASFPCSRQGKMPSNKDIAAASISLGCVRCLFVVCSFCSDG